MSWKKNAAEYLSFTQRDRIAVITLILLIITIGMAPMFMTRKASPTAFSTDSSLLASLRISGNDDSNATPGSNDDDFDYRNNRPTAQLQENKKSELFYFDPNETSEAAWRRLGLRVKTIKTILNYLNKGGHFRKPEDLKKVYGLFPDEFDRLAPFIQIKQIPGDKPTRTYSPEIRKEEKNSSRHSVIDINAADTTAWIALPGIGNKLAQRIVLFREKLGGFYSVDQVAETFGLQDSVFRKIKQYLKLESNVIRKININTATADELKAHPYIKWNLANPIISYRNEHGPFKKIEDLKNIIPITDEIFSKIRQYLVIE